MQKLIQVLTLLIAVLACACSTVPDAPAPSELDCPPVACGWSAENTCPEGSTFSHESTSEALEDGSTCWVYEAACIVTQPEPVNAECIPAACKQNQFTTCTPAK